MPVDPNLVGAHLENILKQQPQRTTNYGAVAQAFGLPDFDGAWASHPLSEIFEVIDQQDAVANRPFRTSVVILKNKNGPGPGFFEAMQRLYFWGQSKNPYSFRCTCFQSFYSGPKYYTEYLDKPTFDM